MNDHARGQVASTAAQIYQEFFVPALFAEWPKHVLRAAGVSSGDAVLDVGCGTGVLARAASAVVGAGGTVIGLDINEGMLAVAQQQTPEITWKSGNAESLPFVDNSFDRVVSQFSLMFYEKPMRAVLEMNRVLRPGGTAAIAVWGTLKATPGYAVMAGILEEIFGAAVASSLKAPYSLGDPTRLAALFADAGIDHIEIQTLTGKARFDSVEAWIYTDIRGWTLADVIDDVGYASLKKYAQPKVADFVQPDGSVVFDTPAHIVTFAK